MAESTVSKSSVMTAVREFIVQDFLFGSDDGTLTNDVSFLQTGVIDSTGILELVTFVENEYGISVDDADLVPENLDSIDNVSRYVLRKLGVPES